MRPQQVARSLAVFPPVLALFIGCDSIAPGSGVKNDLSKLQTVTLAIPGRTDYTAFVVDDDDTRQIGLMNTSEDELPADHGMIFVFPYDRPLSFWMRNTIIPLDIAYIRSDGTIVKTYTMAPLDESGYPSVEAARFALEVRGGQFQQWDIQTGDHVEIPETLLNSPSKPAEHD